MATAPLNHGGVSDGKGDGSEAIVAMETEPAVDSSFPRNGSGPESLVEPVSKVRPPRRKSRGDVFSPGNDVTVVRDGSVRVLVAYGTLRLNARGNRTGSTQPSQPSHESESSQEPQSSKLPEQSLLSQPSLLYPESQPPSPSLTSQPTAACPAREEGEAAVPMRRRGRTTAPLYENQVLAGDGGPESKSPDYDYPPPSWPPRQHPDPTRLTNEHEQKEVMGQGEEGFPDRDQLEGVDRVEGLEGEEGREGPSVPPPRKLSSSLAQVEGRLVVVDLLSDVTGAEDSGGLSEEETQAKEAGDEAEEQGETLGTSLTVTSPLPVAGGLAAWMGVLPAAATRRPLHLLALPGAHNAFSAGLLPELGPAVDLGPRLRGLLHCCCCCSGPLLRWSVTQTLSVTELLQAGVRYLDLRVCAHPSTGEFRFLHGLYGARVADVLGEVRDFLERCPSEVLLLDMNHFYNMGAEQHAELQGLLWGELGPRLVLPASTMSHLTLENLWRGQGRVLVFYHQEQTALWSRRHVLSPWPNTASPRQLRAFLDHTYEGFGAPPDTFYVWHGVLTARPSTVLSRPCSSVQAALAPRAARVFLDWLQQRAGGPRPITICLLDFVEMQGFVPAVVALNYSQP